MVIFDKDQDIIQPEREKAPVYACATLRLENLEVKAVYEGARFEILTGKRSTQFTYTRHSSSIFGQDLRRGEKVRILKATGTLFAKNRVDCETCFVDECGADRVNYGLYFTNDNQLEQTKRVLKDDLRVVSTADLQADGRYKEREGEIIGIGHNLREPHLKHGLLIK